MSENRERIASTAGSIEGVELDFERCYRAVDSRDPRFDGWFVTAVTSTGIYCRPSCPATTPKPTNVRFYPSAAAAQRGGFRACRRCRPDAAPGSPEWNVRADVVGRAMRLIADGVVDRDGVPGLANQLGYTSRHLQRMLTDELGAGPLALARAQRAQTARILIESTDLGLAEIAFAAGFGSVRQFNDTVREVYATAPSDLRKSARREPSGTPGTMLLRLAYRPPLHATALFEFLAARAIPGVETQGGGIRLGHGGLTGDDRYSRALRLPHGTGTVTFTPLPGYVSTELRLADVRDLAPAVARCRRLLDLDADPQAVDETLAADPALEASVRKEPGIRVPRAVDGFETAVRAIVGQQISVAATRTVLGRLVTALTPADPTEPVEPTNPTEPVGPTDPTEPVEPTDPTGPSDRADPIGALRPFPDPASVAAAPDAAFGMPAARRATIRALATAVAGGDLRLGEGADRAETEAALRRIPGIGAWTASYLAMRALGDPDVFLPTDLGVRRGAAHLGLPDDPNALTEHARRWRPWRSYAVIRLWRH